MQPRANVKNTGAAIRAPGDLPILTLYPIPIYHVGAPHVDATGDVEPTPVPGGSGGVAPSPGGVGALPWRGSVRRDLSTDRIIKVEQPNSCYIF